MFVYGTTLFAYETKVREAAEIAARWTRRHRRALFLLAAIVPLVLVLVPVTWVLCHVYLDRGDVPDLEAFLRFQPPTTGAIHDVRGEVLIELAHEYRRVLAYEEVPAVLRSAVLAAEDKNFFQHSGVEYGALPRVLQKSLVRSVSHWWQGDEGFRLLLPQGGSTLTQQLVRGYFLQHLVDEGDRSRSRAEHRRRDGNTDTASSLPVDRTRRFGGTTARAGQHLSRHRRGRVGEAAHHRPGHRRLGGPPVRVETGGRVAMPVFREIMIRLYQDDVLGRAPRFPREIEKGIDRYLAMQKELAIASMALQFGP